MLNLNIITEGRCDRCKKPVTTEAQAYDIWTTGRSYEERNFVTVHIKCWDRAVKKAAHPEED